jgi:hypothetical protein
MRITILLLPSCLLALAAVAVGAESASAANCKTQAGSLALCREINATELELVTLGTFLILQEESSQRTLFRILTATNVIITCLTGEGTAESELTLIMLAKLTFTECTVESPASCELASRTIGPTEPIDGKLTLALELESGQTEELTRMDLLLLPEEQEEDIWLRFTIKSKTGETCPDALTNGKLTGSVLCFWLEELEKDEAEHLFECTASGSESGSLEFAGKADDLEDEFSVLMLTANGASHEDSTWGIFENTE